jgi:hypothetical protein
VHATRIDNGSEGTVEDEVVDGVGIYVSCCMKLHRL